MQKNQKSDTQREKSQASVVQGSSQANANCQGASQGTQSMRQAADWETQSQAHIAEQAQADHRSQLAGFVTQMQRVFVPSGQS